ncbi:MAG: pyridoxamine 5'-phosphate oxidase family protein [Ignavibacteria bacterium]|nr:pyridoxamine 5'-phosphate oxidase family protein [Ignavibacteria bacterium]
MNSELINKGLKIFENCDNALIASVDSDGFPNLKAMLKPRVNNGLKEFYFTTNTSSMRVKQYLQNPKASVYFMNERGFTAIMLTGTMEVLQDSASKELIWREGDTVYYSKGVTDPDYTVLRFTSVKGRIYENFKSYSFNI